MVWVKDVPEEELPPGAVPARWHIENRRGPVPTYSPIVTEDGSYREPDFGVYEDIKSQDMWSERALERTLARDEEKKKRRDHAKELASEQRKDEMRADYRAARRVAGESLTKKRWGKK